MNSTFWGIVQNVPFFKKKQWQESKQNIIC